MKDPSRARDKFKLGIVKCIDTPDTKALVALVAPRGPTPSMYATEV